MKKEKKKREPSRSFSGDPQIEPIIMDILDDQTELNMLFAFSNRGLKMIKAGKVFEKTFLKDGKHCVMHFMHRDVYDDQYKKQIDLRRKLIQSKLPETDGADQE